MSYSNVSIDPSLFDRIAPYVKAGGTNNRAFVQGCVEAICAMIEQEPGGRAVPDIVVRISAVLENRRFPELLTSAHGRTSRALAKGARKRIRVQGLQKRGSV
jgi:hypothetical protein